MRIRVLLVDDHEVVRSGLRTYLELEEDLVISGEAGNGREALRLAEKDTPDVVLMDLVMEDMDGIETTRRLVELYPSIKVVMLTSFYDEKQVLPALEAGAISYLLKTSRGEDIVRAVRAAYRGESQIEPRIAGRLMRRAVHQQPLHEALTDREREVLLMIADGRSNQEIGEKLFIGIKTVKTHVSSILQKLQVEDRTQAAIYAHRHGLAGPSQ